MQIDQSEFEAIIHEHPQKKESLIPILQNLQGKYQYLPPVALNMVSQALDIPLIDILSVATFYNAFSLTPRGRHLIRVCQGTACHVRGGKRVLEAIQKMLDVGPGETTKDNRFTLETVRCLGSCALGPVVVVDEEYSGQMSPKKVMPLLENYD